MVWWEPKGSIAIRCGLREGKFRKEIIMEITKEKIRELKELITHRYETEDISIRANEELEDYLAKQFPEAFEPEIVECEIVRSIDLRYSVLARFKPLDTGVWKIFDAEDCFWIKSDLRAYQFHKESAYIEIVADPDSDHFKRLERP